MGIPSDVSTQIRTTFRAARGFQIAFAKVRGALPTALHRAGQGIL